MDAPSFSGMDATGVLLLSAPDIPAANKYIGLIFMCLIARMLTGFLAGFFFDLVKRFDKRGFFASFAGSLSTAFFNTLFFMSFFVIFFLCQRLYRSRMGSSESVYLRHRRHRFQLYCWTPSQCDCGKLCQLRYHPRRKKDRFEQSAPSFLCQKSTKGIIVPKILQIRTTSLSR